ncbi:MAG: transposase [Bacteroidia bacterium]|nr:transposase [Bacteroidia bacterium]
MFTKPKESSNLCSFSFKPILPSCHSLNTIKHHFKNILNFFNNRKNNVNAESFNPKTKQFRTNLREITDVKLSY